MRLICFFLVPVALFTLFSGSSFGQYANTLIPDSLLPGADAVIREYNLNLDIRSEENASLTVFKAITVLRKKGEHFGQFNLGYDKFRTPNHIVISLYDASGRLVKKVKTSEIRDYSAYEEGTLFSDNRIKSYIPTTNEFPYTIVYEFSVTFKGYLSLPVFQPVSNFGVAVQQSSYSVISEQGVPFRYHEFNFNNIYTSASHNSTHHEWNISGLPALVYEPLAIDIDDVTPNVILSPYKFEYDGSSGDFSSWNTFGNWVNDLLYERNNLPEKTRLQVHQLTDTINGNYEKARRLYEFLQTKARYVSIQLGIGGYQPFSAETVDKLSYGDCKALSNYYISLLHEAGIPAIYAITTMAEGKLLFLNEFPAAIYFNHVVVCIPFENDSVWVECTSSHLPFGAMSEDVVGHPALLVLPEGGKIAYVPEKRKDENIICRSISTKVLADGSAKVQLQISYNGLKLSEGLGQFVLSKKEQSDYLYEDLEINDFVIDRFAYHYRKEEPAMVSLEAEITCNKFGSLSGNRMFLPINQGCSVIFGPEKSDNRKLPFEVSNTYDNIDSLSFLLPEGFTLESMPVSFNSKNAFGSFDFFVQQKDANIIIVKSLKLNKGVYPAAEYSSFRDFIIAIQKSEKQKIFLKKS